MHNKELAARVGLAQSTVLERVRRLVAGGVLTGFYTEVDARQVGVGLQAMISVRLTRHSRRAVEAFRTYVTTVPEVVAVFHTAGQTDFMIHVAVRDAEHLREVELSAFTTRKEVEHLETALIFEHQRKPSLPLYTEPVVPRKWEENRR
jgi:DNA-binding Lrp family transcriptional regulator